jgi:hypothetical protein
MHLPVFRQLFTSNDISKGQTDIVILLTPRIIRTHELTQRDIDPLYIGSQQNLGIGGPPPLIAAPPVTEPAPTPPNAIPPEPGTATQPPPMPGTLARPGIMPEAAPPATPVPAQPTPPPLQPEPAPTPAPPVAEAAPQTTSAAMRVLVTPPGPEMRLGGGPYTVPVSVGNVPRVSTLSITITFNPAIVRVRAVQEGSFMRQGGVSASFSQQIDPVAGRVDITVVRGQDVVGATGTGLVAALVVEPVALGSTSFGIAGMASGPGGAPISVTATPAAVSVK